MNDNFKGKVAIVTGGSMGIGREVAYQLAIGGGKVIIAARNEGRLLEVVKELTKLGADANYFVCDLTDAKACEQLVEFAIKCYGKLDILVNNAGVSMRGRVADIQPKVVENIFAINTLSPIWITHFAMPAIQASKGSILFVSSLAGLQGLPLISIYSSAKMALTAIVQSLWVEHSRDAIHIGIVYVGVTEIDKTKATIDANGEQVLLDERKGKYVHSMAYVAGKIVQAIRKRKKKTIIGVMGKTYYFLTRYLGKLAIFLTKKSYQKSGKLYK